MGQSLNNLQRVASIFSTELTEASEQHVSDSEFADADDDANSISMEVGVDHFDENANITRNVAQKDCVSRELLVPETEDVPPPAPEVSLDDIKAMDDLEKEKAKVK